MLDAQTWCTERWGGFVGEGPQWLGGFMAWGLREREQPTQVVETCVHVRACVCCWPLHISTTLPQFVFCVQQPQNEFPPSCSFKIPPHTSDPHMHEHYHHPSPNIWTHTRTFYKPQRHNGCLCCLANKVCVWDNMIVSKTHTHTHTETVTAETVS